MQEVFSLVGRVLVADGYLSLLFPVVFSTTLSSRQLPLLIFQFLYTS
jgi:hypothetical protein